MTRLNNLSCLLEKTKGGTGDGRKKEKTTQDTEGNIICPDCSDCRGMNRSDYEYDTKYCKNSTY